MLDSVRFLEALGESPSFDSSSVEQLEPVMQQMQLGQAERAAIRSGDIDALKMLADANGPMAMIIWAPEDEPAKKEQPNRRDPGKTEPDGDDEAE